MSFFICLHNTYNSVEVVLSSTNSILNKVSITKECASANLIPQIDNLLKSSSIKINEITCLIVNQGPAPFTTLRTMIATANGISFATKIPLVGVDGLTSLLHEYTDQSNFTTIALLNAFNKAVYYALQLDKNAVPIIGYDSITSVLLSLKEQLNDSTVRFIGNGASLYKKEILEIFGNDAYIPEPLPQTSSVEFILKQGLEQWHQKFNIYKQLEPLYLKKAVV